MLVPFPMDIVLINILDIWLKCSYADSSKKIKFSNLERSSYMYSSKWNWRVNRLTSLKFSNRLFTPGFSVRIFWSKGIILSWFRPQSTALYISMLTMSKYIVWAVDSCGWSSSPRKRSRNAAINGATMSTFEYSFTSSVHFSPLGVNGLLRYLDFGVEK